MGHTTNHHHREPMALTVTKPGKLPEPEAVIITGTCGHCGCELTGPAHDWHYQPAGVNGLGQRRPIHYVSVCPTQGCGRQIVAYAPGTLVPR